MSLPVKLFQNTLSIYGHASIYGLGIPKGYMFGLVEQTSPNLDASWIGQSVLFKSDGVPVIRYQTKPIYLIQEEDVILTENQ